MLKILEAVGRYVWGGLTPFQRRYAITVGVTWGGVDTALQYAADHPKDPYTRRRPPFERDDAVRYAKRFVGESCQFGSMCALGHSIVGASMSAYMAFLVIPTLTMASIPLRDALDDMYTVRRMRSECGSQ